MDRVLREIEPSAGLSRELLVNVVRSTVASYRESHRPASLDIIVADVRRGIEALARPRLEPVINGTGVIIHTNLGRAPVSRATAQAMAEAAAGFVPLEIEPDSNTRGGRMREVSDLMRLLCGAERTLVVNNNAAALLVTLAGLAEGREVLVARGEAVEIGGGFRVPDVVAQGGCRLVDVGTTNKTRAADYTRAMGPSTGAILKVHPSNFVVEGFTEEASVAELAVVGRENGVPLVHDIGSGAPLDTAAFGLRSEPTFQHAIGGGADIVTASGDKLLGGPQAGILCGRRDLVERIERHPLARALRADKTTLAGVAATLRHYLAGTALDDIPVWRMIAMPVSALRGRAEHLSSVTGLEVVEMRSTVGGGSLPGQEMASVGLAATADDIDTLASRLRMGHPRVFGRIQEGRLLIDLRTVGPEQDDALGEALAAATA